MCLTLSRHPSKTILVKPAHLRPPKALPLAGLGLPHTTLIQITSLILIPLHTNDRDDLSGGEDHFELLLSFDSCYVSSSLPLMS